MAFKSVEPVDLTMDDLIKEWKELCSIEKDVHAALSGGEGDGKTHLLIQTIKKFPNTSIGDNIIYTGSFKEFEYKYEQMEENSIIGFDEALDIINRLDWNKMETKDLVRIVRGTVRKEKRGIFLYNVQLFRDLHSYWRNHRISFWLELTPREWFENTNKVFVLEKSRVPFVTGKRDTWLLNEEESEWLKTMRKGILKGKPYMNMLRAHPFYIGETRFNKLKDRDVTEYMKRREEARDTWKMEVHERLGKRESMWKDRAITLANWAVQHELIQRKFLAKDLWQIDETTLSRQLNEPIDMSV